MKNRRPTLLTLLLLSLFLTLKPAHSQATVGEFNAQALQAMGAQDWPKAYGILEAATDRFDPQAPTIFGPRFGWFWYHRGFCALKLGKYNDAAKAFEKCYNRYPNNVGAVAGEGKNQSFNHYHKMALLKWGDALKGEENWADAIRMYKKFMEERDNTRDIKFSLGVYYINMAVCHFKLLKIKEGTRNLETAIVNKVKFPTPNRGIMLGFHSLVEAVVEKGEEKPLLDFIAKNRSHITLDPFEAYDFAPLFMKLAQDAKGADMTQATFELYSLIPSTITALDDINARITAVGSHPRTIEDGSKIVNAKALKTQLDDLKKNDREGSVHEVYAFLNTALMHEDAGNTRGAFACYEQLELYYPKAKIVIEGKQAPAREKNLFNLVRTSSLIGEVLTTEKYGSLFLKDYPDSNYKDEVRRMMLSSLFWEGEYEKCIEVATVMRDKLTAPSKPHDICLFVLGGSYYYTGQYDKAHPLIEEHIKTYPEDKTEKHRRQAILYFQASNLSRLQEWAKSAALLDAFLAKYPEAQTNIYMPFALYDRSECHYAEEELDPALEKLTKVENEFPGVEVMEQVYNLKGNVLRTQSVRDQAEKYYLLALELAEMKKNHHVAGEALFYLVAILGEEKIDKKPNPDIAKCVPFYDQFWEKYGAESPYKAQVAVAGLAGLRSVKRGEEALNRLQQVIAEISKIPGTPGLEETLNSYTEAYLEDHTVEQLKTHYYNFEGVDSEDDATNALLRIAVISVAEDQLKEAQSEKDEDKINAANSLIKVLFNDLKKEYAVKDLTNYILVRIGDFLREKTSAPEQARSYYEEVIRRPDLAFRRPALFGVADILGRGSKQDKAQAITHLQDVYSNADKNEQKEIALHRMVTILYDLGEYEKCAERAKEYLTNKKFTKKSPHTRLILAQTYQKRSLNEDAIVIYGQCWTSVMMGTIAVSAPAILGQSELLWDRNQTDPKTGKSDRQYVYENLFDYIKITSRFKDKFTDSDLKLWNQVNERLQEVASHSSITPFEEEKK